MSLFEIVLHGIVQGLTEFFPVSSSGHLVFLQNLLGFREPQLIIDVMLHVGTLLSLFIFLRREILELTQSFGSFCLSPKKNISDPKIKLIFSLTVASLPTALIGYFFHDFFESLFSSLRVVGVALLITASFLLLTKFAREKKKKDIVHPFIIGILQGLAIIPGLSRSGLTIGGALLLGWKRREAAQFSFLLSIPAILGASLFELQKIDSNTEPWFPLITGIFVAAFVGFIALTLLVRLINKGKFHSFSYYCLLVGLAALILSFLT